MSQTQPLPCKGTSEDVLLDVNILSWRQTSLPLFMTGTLGYCANVQNGSLGSASRMGTNCPQSVPVFT